jgi:hypothetical protein
MRYIAFAFLCFSALGCEQMWVVEGQVDLAPELELGRPLSVVVIHVDEIPGDDVPVEAWSEFPYSREEPVRDEAMTEASVSFGFEEFGCHNPLVHAIAFAPAADGGTWQAPEPGDYYASTGWIDKEPCGYSGTQELSLTLEKL